MVWALAILFAIATILLIFSLIKIKQTTIKEQREIDHIYLSMVKEIDGLKKQIRNLELDLEIITEHPNYKEMPVSKRTLLREILDLYKRGYSIQGIADEVQLTENEVEMLLTPYSSGKKERSTA